MIEVAKQAGADEVVSAKRYGPHLLAQEAFAEGICEIYDRLLAFEKDSCELYLVRCGDGEHDVPTECWEGKTFREVARVIRDVGEKNPAILIGVKQDGRVLVNPKNQYELKLKHGDELIVIAYDRPRWSARDQTSSSDEASTSTAVGQR